MKTNEINQFSKPGYLVIGTVRSFAKVIRFFYSKAMDTLVKPKRNIISNRIFHFDPAGNPGLGLIDAALTLALFVLLKPLNRIIVLLRELIKLSRTLVRCINRMVRMFLSGCCGEAGYLNKSRSGQSPSNHDKSFHLMLGQLAVG